jgi:DNA-binding response OmpR family regulator
MSRILLVEDDMLLRPLMTGVLEKAGYEVVDVGTVREALVQAGPWDLLLLDQVLPNGQGRRVAEFFAGTPTLYATAYPAEVPAGARVLPKPFIATELVREVGKLVPPTGAS